MRSHFVVAIVAVACAARAGQAAAAEVTFTLTSFIENSDNGHFTLEVVASAGDNAGLAGYDVEVVGASTYDNVPPAGTLGPTRWTGFVLERSGDDANGKFFGAQRNFQQGTLTYGLAQPGVTPTWPDIGLPLNIPTDWDGLLARGEFSNGPVSFGDDANATLFVANGAPNTIGNLSRPPRPFAPGDFDEDDEVDQADATRLLDNFNLQSGSAHALGDADEDGDTDGTDYLIWQEMFPTLNGEYDGSGVDGPVVIHRVVVTRLASDGDGDDDVDGDDFLIWQSSFGVDDGGDYDGDDDTDGNDFLIWQSQFGSQLGGGSASSAAIPEPTSLFLSILFTGALFVFRKWRAP